MLQQKVHYEFNCIEIIAILNVTLDGKQALKNGKVYFNQKASDVYKAMCETEREELTRDMQDPIPMTCAEEHKRRRKIFHRMNDMVLIFFLEFQTFQQYFVIHVMQFIELEELTYCGFAIAFKGSKVEIVGTPSVLNSLTPQIIEYLRGIVVTCMWYLCTYFQL